MGCGRIAGKYIGNLQRAIKGRSAVTEICDAETVTMEPFALPPAYRPQSLNASAAPGHNRRATLHPCKAKQEGVVIIVKPVLKNHSPDSVFHLHHHRR
jgi:hypothetical protein